MNANIRNRSTRFVATVAAILFASLLVACAPAVTKDAQYGTARDTLRFHIVRHAEKANEPGKDPGLSGIGDARADRLAQLLRDEPIVAVYATDYRRTQSTAAPTASTHGLTVLTYDAALSAVDFAEKLRDEHRKGAVLIVGHSNTVAPIASALCGCEVAPLSEQEFDRWIAIDVDADGKAMLRSSRY